MALAQQPLRQGHAAEPLGAAGPFVACEGIDVSRSGCIGHRNLPEALGGIHQQERLAAMAAELFGDLGDRHDLAGVPEQVRQHHQSGCRPQSLVHFLQDAGGGIGRITAELLHRQGVDQQVVAAGQFDAGRHNAGVLAIADQQPIARFKGQAPERQHAARCHVFTERQSMGGDAADLGKLPPGAVDLGADVRPHLGGEGTQFLNPSPAFGDRLEGRCRQWALAAVVEVGLVRQGWAEFPKRWAVCLSQGAVLKGAQLHRQSNRFLVDIADESPCFLETTGRCLIDLDSRKAGR